METTVIRYKHASGNEAPLTNIDKYTTWIWYDMKRAGYINSWIQKELNTIRLFLQAKQSKQNGIRILLVWYTLIMVQLNESFVLSSGNYPFYMLHDLLKIVMYLSNAICRQYFVLNSVILIRSLGHIFKYPFFNSAPNQYKDIFYSYRNSSYGDIRIHYTLMW